MEGLATEDKTPPKRQGGVGENFLLPKFLLIIYASQSQSFNVHQVKMD